MNRFAIHSLYSAIAGLSTVLASFISGVIVANLLGVEGVGVVAFAVWIALVAAPVIDGGTAMSVSRFSADLRGRDDTAAARALPGRLARRLLAYNLLGAAALGVFYFAGADGGFPSLETSLDGLTAGVPVNLALIVAILISLQSFAMFGAAYFRGVQNFVTLAILTFVSMIAQIVCVYAGVRYYGIPGAIAGYAVGQLCLAAATLGLLWRRGPLSPAITGQIRQYGRFSWAANVCNTFVWSRIEILFLQLFWSYREVGWFSVALALAALASQGPLLLTGAFLPMLSKKHGQDDRAGLQAAFSSGTRMLAMLAFPICFFMAAVVPVLIGFLYGPEFKPAVPTAMIIVTAAAFTITTVIGTHLVNALARSDFIFFSSLAGALLSVVLGLLLIPDLGLVGAAISRAATQLAMIGLGLWFIITRLGFSYPFQRLSRILLAALVAASTAYFTVALLGDLRGLLAAACLAPLVYLTALRFLRATDPEDISVLRRLKTALPRPLAGFAGIILSFIHPAPTPSNATTTR